jgi:hypothetical protein
LPEAPNQSTHSTTGASTKSETGATSGSEGAPKQQQEKTAATKQESSAPLTEQLEFAKHEPKQRTYHQFYHECIQASLSFCLL